jgi:internalin A
MKKRAIRHHMTPEEAYEEALRRIREVEKTGAIELDLSGLPLELGRLTSLQSLDLNEYAYLRDLSPLAILTSLQSLSLSRCGFSGDLSPLAALTSLQQLDLSGCRQLSDLSPLARLTSLQQLDLAWCKQLSDLSHWPGSLPCERST